MTEIHLVKATFELLDAAIEEPTRLAHLLDALIADDWAGFTEALPGLRRAYAEARGADDWGTRLFVLDGPHRRTLIGMGGYKGGPSATGSVEIGYAIAPAFRGRGLATEASRQLIAGGFADPRVKAIEAHTLAQPNASTRVLEKLGF